MVVQVSGWRSKQWALQVRIFFGDGSSLQLFSHATGVDRAPIFSTGEKFCMPDDDSDVVIFCCLCLLRARSVRASRVAVASRLAAAAA